MNQNSFLKNMFDQMLKNPNMLNNNKMKFPPNMNNFNNNINKPQQDHEKITTSIRNFYGITSEEDEYTLFASKYTNIEFFGNGAFGLVFKVYDSTKNVWRVVKKMDINNILKYLKLEEYMDIIQKIQKLNSP